MNGEVSVLRLRTQIDNADVNKVTIVVCPLLSLMVSLPVNLAYSSNVG